MESLWRSGKAIGRGIRRLQVQFHMEDKNFFYLNPSLDKKKKQIFTRDAPFALSSRSLFPPLAQKA